MARVYLGFGSNLGRKVGNIRRAVEGLKRLDGVESVSLSPFYRSAPVGKLDQDWFVNAAAQIDTSLEPEALLERCLELESKQGRVRRERWGPRTIDIDILLYDNRELREEALQIPHPRLGERVFALAPLLDLGVEALPSIASVRDRIEELSEQAVERMEPVVAVLGASANPERYSYRALELLLENGYRVAPVNPRGGELLGERVYKDLLSCDQVVDTVTLYLGSDRIPLVLEQLLEAMPRRVVFNPGTENAEARQELEDAGIEVIEACTLVMLRTGQW